MLQIGYFSTARELQDAQAVHGILTESRRANRRDSISGLLVAGERRYLQVIEGPDKPVEALFDRIKRDRRHLAVATFLNRTITERSFGNWSMAFRRQSALGEQDIFVQLLCSLTAEISDVTLKHQIHFFVCAAMEPDSRRLVKLRPAQPVMPAVNLRPSPRRLIHL